MANVADVFSANEVKAYIGEYDETDEDWEYERVKFKRSVNPDLPDNTRRVYDGLRLEGVKRTRAENNLEIEAEFQGFNEGLFQYANKSGLLVKAVIEPEQVDAPEDDIRYFYNWNPQQPDITLDDVDEFNVTLSGAIDGMYEEEPEDDDFEVPTT